jgi:asparagine synthetase B (glutamine-hydrolysing)
MRVINKAIPDPGLVMEALLKWGEKFVKKLNGDFTIFVY